MFREGARSALAPVEEAPLGVRGGEQRNVEAGGRSRDAAEGIPWVSLQRWQLSLLSSSVPSIRIGRAALVGS